ncbi:unnamed protein product [Symbiodinium natans]|uniref:Uncharacterized protein n=1 Tax=Symbiodinium natans TaxID=878477 RepID=A0A812RWN2_9DINO|nr:unnamed protein product [Symbiodinium natans]
MAEDAAQQIINAFVDGLAAGRTLPMLRPAGMEPCNVQMDRARTALSIRPQSGQARRVPLETISQISVGAENVEEVNLPLDDFCVTLKLDDEQTLYAFQFQDDEARDTFALCLGMFVDQRRAEAEEEQAASATPVSRAVPEALPQAPARGYAKAPGKVPPAPTSYPSSSQSARGVPSGLEAYQADAEASASLSARSKKKELTDGQKLVKRFVQKMVKGRELKMLSTTGRSLLCLVMLDRDIRHLSIQLAGKADAKQRFVNLKSIEQIYVGDDVAEDIELPVTTLSVTLVLEEGQAIAFELADEEERDTFACVDQEIMTQQQMVQISKQAGPAQQWMTTPTLAPGMSAQNDSSVAWYPTVRLLFRQPLPTAWSAQNEILCGRISVEVMALTGDRLRDTNLGENGRTYVVDSSGAVLSALDLQDTITVDSVGTIQFRHISQIPGSDGGHLVASAFKGNRIEALRVQEGSLAAVVQPLNEPLDMFAVVVISRYENTSFQDQSIVESMSVLLTFASLPYAIMLVTLVTVLVSANSGLQLSKLTIARITGAASSLTGRKRNRSVIVRSSSEGPLFNQEMEGMGNKVSQKSIVMGDESMYDDDGRPLAVQHRRTHVLNDVYFASAKTKYGCLIRCARRVCCCCLGRQRE